MSDIEKFLSRSRETLRLSGFRKFILRGNVIDLAIGVVIGAAFTALVNGLVADFLTPLINIPLGNNKEFAKQFFKVSGLIDPPSRLLRPKFLYRVVRSNRSVRQRYSQVGRPANAAVSG